MTQDEIKIILEKHKKWLIGEDGGNRANLSYANLRYTDLSGADLSGADLSYAILSNADLSGADLRGADLSGANLSYAILRYAILRGANLSYANLSYAILSDADLSYAILSGADLRGADLRYADLRYADLRYAILRGANLRGADLRYAILSNAILSNADLRGADLSDIHYDYLTVGLNLYCPEEGSFIGFKKIYSEVFEPLLCKLEIPEDALRSSATTRKCRASKAKVIEILARDEGGNFTIPVKEGYSTYGRSFKYIVGEIVESDSFDCDRWNECSNGIHFFITKKEAIEY